MITCLKSDWKVRLTRDKKLLRVNGKICKGAVHYKDCVIYIDADATEYQLERLIRHELSHVLIYETQIQQKESYSEEDLCEFMAIYSPVIEVNAVKLIQQIKESRNNQEILSQLGFDIIL